MGAANGREAHVVQRVFWALSEGAVAIVLIKTGGTSALKALRALSIIAGLPFTVVMFYMCTSLWRALGAEMDPEPKLKGWKMSLYGGIFDIVESLITCCRAPVPEAKMWKLFFQGLVAPPLLVWKGLRNLSTSTADGGSLVSDIVLTIGSTVSFYAFVLLQCLVSSEGGLVGISWSCYVAFVVAVSYVRHVMRVREGITGNGVEDFFASMFFYPQVLAQIAQQAEEPTQTVITKAKAADVSLEAPAVENPKSTPVPSAEEKQPEQSI